MLKLVGMCISSFAVWLLFNDSARKFKNKIYTEDAYLSLIFFIKSMIAADNMPLCKIYEKYKDSWLEKTGFCDELKRRSVNSLSMALEKTKRFDCDKRVHSLMVSFSESICSCVSPDDCLSVCDKFYSLIEAETSLSRSNDLKKAELYRKLSFICAATVFVLFI